MEWTVTIEGRDDFGEVQRAQMRIEKDFERLKPARLVCRWRMVSG